LVIKWHTISFHYGFWNKLHTKTQNMVNTIASGPNMK
jgi:hypothetical protein